MARVQNPSPAVQKHVDKIVKEFIAGLKKGEMPWSKPWVAVGRPLPFNGYSGKDYRGINTLALWRQSLTNEWWTEKQAAKVGGKLAKKKGRQLIVFQAKMINGELADGEEVADTDDGHEETSFLSAVYAVYPRENFVDLPPSKHVAPPPASVDGKGHKRSEHVEAAIKATGADVREIQSDRAFYSPSEDKVVVPTLQQFKSANAYYATLWHELTHWSGGPKRLHREFGREFGDAKYAFEELVAELGAVLCCTALGIECDTLHHQSYINHWIGKLQSQPTYLMRAAAKASQALEYLLPDLNRPIKPKKAKKAKK